MAGTREPAVAGLFYPESSSALQAQVESLLSGVKGTAGPPPRALIAPHAGYIYSGPIAASAYSQLAPLRDTVRRVVLIGPSHRVPFEGIASSSVDCWATPLGTVPLDRKAIAEVEDVPSVNAHDHAHADEHSLEVQLPFLQVVLSDFAIVPLVVGEAEDGDAEQALELLWGGPETLIAVSSDLSHYHDYETARVLDESTRRAVESLDATAITWEQACGGIALRGLLGLARKLSLRAETLDLRNSGDTSGSRDRVVGYGAWAFHENAAGE